MSAVQNPILLFGDEEAKSRAGKGHHGKSASTTWLTPPSIIDSLGGSGSFDLDPACAPEMPWLTARKMYSKASNGLMNPWFGRVWLNPPWGGPSIIGPWMRRMADHGCGIMLVPAATETVNFFECVWLAESATGILFVLSRPHFHRADGRRSNANCGTPIVLVSYGDEDAAKLRDSGIAGKFIPLTKE